MMLKLKWIALCFVTHELRFHSANYVDVKVEIEVARCCMITEEVKGFLKLTYSDTAALIPDSLCQQFCGHFSLSCYAG